MQYRVLNTEHVAVLYVVDGQTIGFLAREEKPLDEAIVNHPDFAATGLTVIGPIEIMPREPQEVQEADDREVHVVEEAVDTEPKAKRKRNQ